MPHSGSHAVFLRLILDASDMVQVQNRHCTKAVLAAFLKYLLEPVEHHRRANRQRNWLSF